MTDVFLSYASEDRERAATLARSLEPTKEPPALSYNPHGDVAYSGRKG